MLAGGFMLIRLIRFPFFYFFFTKRIKTRKKNLRQTLIRFEKKKPTTNLIHCFFIYSQPPLKVLERKK